MKNNLKKLIFKKLELLSMNFNFWYLLPLFLFFFGLFFCDADESINDGNEVKKTYTVQFEVVGGSKIEDISYTKGGDFTIPKNPTKQNFRGWHIKYDKIISI